MEKITLKDTYLWCEHSPDRLPEKQKTLPRSNLVSTHLKNISQNGNLPQIGMKIKNIWNHHLVLSSPKWQRQSLSFSRFFVTSLPSTISGSAGSASSTHKDGELLTWNEKELLANRLTFGRLVLKPKIISWFWELMELSSVQSGAFRTKNLHSRPFSGILRIKHLIDLTCAVENGVFGWFLHVAWLLVLIVLAKVAGTSFRLIVEASHTMSLTSLPVVTFPNPSWTLAARMTYLLCQQIHKNSKTLRGEGLLSACKFKG